MMILFCKVTSSRQSNVYTKYSMAM
jgi:hypothetical protein